MSFEQRFQIAGEIPRLAGSQDCALSGKELQTTRPVTIHLLAGGYSAANRALLAEIESLSPAYKACFLETGDYNGIPYVVTDAITGNPPLRDWMGVVQKRRVEDELARLARARSGKALEVAGQAAGPSVPAKAAAGPAEPAAAAGPGEFTRLFGAPSSPSVVTPAPAPTAPPAAPPVPAPSAEPGEFTRFFGGLSAPSAAPAPPAPPTPPAAPPVPAPSTEPGEFTRFFGGLSAPPVAPAPPAPPAALPSSRPPATPPAGRQDEPGEFTRLLRNPLAPRPGEPAPMPAQPAGSPLSPSQPGEFTRIFGTPAPRAAPPYQAPVPEPPVGKPPGEFTRMFNASPAAQDLGGDPLTAPPPRPSPGAEWAFQAVPPAQPGTATEPAGPSEYTKMFARPAAAPPEPAPKPVRKAVRRPAPRKKDNALWWIVGGAAAVLLAIVLYLALR